jgi:hypothetical protein
MEPVEVVTGEGDRYRVPVGSTSDGASTPRIGWDAIPPFGPYWLAAVVHDSAYRGNLERQREDGTWTPAMLSKNASDTLFLDLMTALGVEQGLKETIYEGVKFFAWRAFRDDRKPLTPGQDSG